MHDAHEDAPLTTENRFQRVVAPARHAREIAHVRGSSMAHREKRPAISARVGNDAKTPRRVTAIAAASTAIRNDPLQVRPAARAAISAPQNTSPAPTVSTAATAGASDRTSPSAVTRDHPLLAKGECDFARAHFAQRARGRDGVLVAAEFDRLAPVDHDEIDKAPVILRGGIGG